MKLNIKVNHINPPPPDTLTMEITSEDVWGWQADAASVLLIASKKQISQIIATLQSALKIS
jgi:hypothetical protein